MLRLIRVRFAALVLGIVCLGVAHGAAATRVPFRTPLGQFSPSPSSTRMPQRLTASPRIVSVGTVVTVTLSPADGDTSLPISFGDGTRGTLLPVAGAPMLAAKHTYATGNLAGFQACSDRPVEAVMVAPNACTRIVVRFPAATPAPAPTPMPTLTASPIASPVPTLSPVPTATPTPSATPTASATPSASPTPSSVPTRAPLPVKRASPSPSVMFANAYVTVAFPNGVQELQVPYGTLAPGPIAQVVAATSGRITLQWSIDGLVVSTLNFNVVAGSITPVTYTGLLPVGGNHTLVATLVPSASPFALSDPRTFVHYAYGTPGGVAPSEVTALPTGVADRDAFFAISDGRGRISLFWYPEASRLTVPAFRLTEVYAGKERALLSSVTTGDPRVQNTVTKADLAAVADLPADFATARASGKTLELAQLVATKVFADFPFAQAAGFARDIDAYDVGPRTYRVVELDPSGAPTDVAIESNVVDPAVPSQGLAAVAGLTATVSGHAVALGWSPPAGDAPYALAYDIVRAASGVTLDLTPVPQLLGTTWAAPPQFLDPSAPPGTATYTVRAVDVFGRRGEPVSATISVPASGAL